MNLLRSVASAVMGFVTSTVFERVLEHGGKRTVDAAARKIGQDRRSGDTLLSSEDYRQLPELNSPAGYLYIIRDGEKTNRHRFGIVDQPLTDLQKLKMETPFKIEVVALLECQNAEGFMQRLCQTFAKNREGSSNWYKLKRSDLRKIDELRDSFNDS